MKNNLNTLIANVTNAFKASLDLHTSLLGDLKALNASERKEFLNKAADAVAKIAAKRSGENIVAYNGQRGKAFGVPEYDEEGALKRHERTEAANATRMWFTRNVAVYFKTDDAAPKAESNKIWETIVNDLSAARKVAKSLKPTMQKEFERELRALIEQYQ